MHPHSTLSNGNALRFESALNLLTQPDWQAAPGGALAARSGRKPDRRAGRPVQPRRPDRAWPTAATSNWRWQREVDRVARSGEPALLLVLDIDHFKRVNDTHGHAAGDQVIQAVAAALIDSVRPMDLVARVGGEEFAIILPNCASAFGEAVAERVRRRVEQMPVAIAPSGQQISVTISVGGAFAPQWVRSTPALWLERADQQLYLAKAQGRNLVRLEPTTVSVVSNEEKRLLFETFQFQDHE